MKKIILLFSLCVIAMACSQEESFDLIPESHDSNQSSVRSFEEALEIAQNAGSVFSKAVSQNSEAKKAKSLIPTKTVEMSNYKIICSSSRKIKDNQADTLLYVFNYEDQRGFAIVSANKETEGLLAMTESGSYNENSEENELSGIDFFMTLAKNYAMRGGGGMEPLIPVYTIDTIYSEVYPLISVKWGQSIPEGIYCPNGIAGCVNTAMAQIMSYYEYPQSINLTYENADITSQALDWTEMKKHILYYLQNGHEYSLYCTANDSAHNAIGRLCRQLGHLNNSIYFTDGSGTGVYSETYVKPTFQFLGYNCNNWNNYSSGNTKSYLDANKPIFFIGRRENSSGTTSGHAWVVDGYYRMTISKFYFTGEVETRNIMYNHVNWGWRGINNGYFLDNVFNTADYYLLDPNPSNASVSYNYNQNIRYIVPSL